ncbi:ArsR/SmtB family transcription factor [Streptosporangium sandarakinum]|uniref:ArsR/SmtB family transcription factor n=1 Tax=Streptosporangium sandarakinum TaxID=1260955 RepID=UPI003789E5B9
MGRGTRTPAERHGPVTRPAPARVSGVTPSAVSRHLRVLHESGLVSHERSGRNVLYLTTALGASLLGTTQTCVREGTPVDRWRLIR